jgi:hypothetical protein
MKTLREYYICYEEIDQYSLKRNVKSSDAFLTKLMALAHYDKIKNIGLNYKLVSTSKCVYFKDLGAL